MNLFIKDKLNGHRMTRVRKGLIEIFSTKHMPLSARELNRLLKITGIKVNKTTIYREIKFLLKQGIIVEAGFYNRTKRYERVGVYHHHHLICERCGDIEEVPLNENFLISQVARQTKFKINRHSLEFYGYCTNCQ